MDAGDGKVEQCFFCVGRGALELCVKTKSFAKNGPLAYPLRRKIENVLLFKFLGMSPRLCRNACSRIKQGTRDVGRQFIISQSVITLKKASCCCSARIGTAVRPVCVGCQSFWDSYDWIADFLHMWTSGWEWFVRFSALHSFPSNRNSLKTFIAPPINSISRHSWKKLRQNVLASFKLCTWKMPRIQVGPGELQIVRCPLAAHFVEGKLGMFVIHAMT